jgi:hypothetical protein
MITLRCTREGIQTKQLSKLQNAQQLQFHLLGVDFLKQLTPYT